MQVVPQQPERGRGMFELKFVGGVFGDCAMLLPPPYGNELEAGFDGRRRNGEEKGSFHEKGLHTEKRGVQC